jgi:hypothetical protein
LTSVTYRFCSRRSSGGKHNPSMVPLHIGYGDV